MKKLTKKQFEKLELIHEIAIRDNDYLKMIMQGSPTHELMKQYIRDNDLCNHSLTSELQGGQIIICRNCGKEWS